MTIDQECGVILQQPCPYKVPPFTFLNGHSFCPCITKAIRTAYVGGYRAAQAGQKPELGIESVDPRDTK